MIESQRPPTQVSLEDLLRLKRAERPAPEFWATFEDQLRHKQLAAIVDKRPWWRRISLASLRRLSIPMGATAVVAFTLISLRDHTRPASKTELTIGAADTSLVQPSNASTTSSQRGAETDSVAPSVEPVGLASDENKTAPAITEMSPSAKTTQQIVSSSVASDSSEPSLAQVILGIDGASEADPRSQFDASTVLVSLNGGADRRDISGLPSMASPLAPVAAPSENRRSLILASLDSSDREDSASSPSRAARSRDRIASRLTEQALYDSISRLGLNGDSVTIKF